MHSIRFTFFLLLILFVPFYLMKIGYEPYPAILLPEGAGIMLKKNDRITFNYFEVYGLNEKKGWQKIDADQLLTPLPSQYFDSILDKLDSSSYTTTKKYKLLQRYHLLENLYTQHSADQWFISKLKQQHLYPYTLRTVNLTVTINLATGKEFNKITDEKILQLYK
jgi:hypothetical protein